MSSCLHFIVQSVRFAGGIVKPKDEIRISLTTLPSHGKDHHTVPASKLASFNHEFVINCDTSMQLLILARRKSYINGDPIIGGAKINVSTMKHDKPIETTINLQEVLTVNDKSSIQKNTGTMSIRAYFDDTPKNAEPVSLNKSQETASQKKIQFDPAQCQTPPPPMSLANSQSMSSSHASFELRKDNSLQPFRATHARRKSLVPKRKKNEQFIEFDDSCPLAQPVTNQSNGFT